MFRERDILILAVSAILVIVSDHPGTAVFIRRIRRDRRHLILRHYGCYDHITTRCGLELPLVLPDPDA